jgi:hypothetical protein
MRSSLKKTYQAARETAREAVHKGGDYQVVLDALEYLTLAAQNGHPVAARLFKSLGKKGRTVSIKNMIVDGNPVGHGTITFRVSPFLAETLPLPPLTNYPPLPTV